MENKEEMPKQELEKSDYTLDEIAEIDEINKRLAKATQKIHTVRFNPFRDPGVNQSFATAFLNESDDGVVIVDTHSKPSAARVIVEGRIDFDFGFIWAKQELAE